MSGKIISLEEYREKLRFAETRVAWEDFPPIFIFNPLGTASKHPDYDEAKKEGNPAAALKLVQDLVSDEKLEELKAILGDEKPYIVPVHAIEEFGTNKIPVAFAYYLAKKLECEYYDKIVQANRPQRTGKGAFYRLSQYPFFDGIVQKDSSYVIVDDTVTMGGTLASLRGYIENKGGKVLSAVALTGHPGASKLNISEKMLKALSEKHGDDLNEWWKSEIGFGVDKLTQGEAGHLKATSTIEEIRSRITEGRSEK